jgi:succinyl-CoA synthetase alpha subunit
VPHTLTSVRQAYVDSVTLLQVTAEVLGLDGVEDAAVVMATELNRELLGEAGLLQGDALDAGPNDLVIAVRASDESAARSALAHVESLLVRRRSTASQVTAPPRSLRSAHRADPEARLAVISVPGQFAAGEARQALVEGLHVFLFSDNVALEDEVSLKRLAQQRGLLVMGPDCGTSILQGVGLGFANVVRRGRIGVVGASGTGIQELTSLVHAAGQGISHAIGTGSRDLHAAVGGVTTLQAIDLLSHDTRTDTVVLISKPSDGDVAARVLQALARTGKPAVAYLQGSGVEVPDGVSVAGSLAEAARLSIGVHADDPDVVWRPVRLSTGQRQVRGLFCGGTLAQEAVELLGDVEHQVIDFGDDQYTRGRAHPMIDPTLRNQAIVQAGNDPRVAVLLLDFIVGLGSHTDPVGAAVGAIREAVETAAGEGRQLGVVAHVVGTDLDPQGLARQEAALRAAGVEPYASSSAAAYAARLALATAVTA